MTSLSLSIPRKRRSTTVAHGLSLEHLESRLLLSVAAAQAIPSAGSTAVASVKKYRIDAWSQEEAASTPYYGNSYTNTQLAQAQNFFNRFKNRYTPYVNPAPVSPIPDSTPAPDPVLPETPVSPEPPTTPVNHLPPVTITQDAKGSLTRLTITGTTSNDSIVVSQSGSTLTIVANGETTSVTGDFAELAIYGGVGDDAITVQSSVNISSLLYGGAGTNAIIAGGSVKSYIVTLGAGSDTVTGNGSNTSFWVDTSDTVNASSAESANGDIHRVASFYQPFSSTPGSAGYISTALNGADLLDPTDSGATIRLNNSLWGAGPAMTDINQGSVGDCYFLSSIQSLAYAMPGKLQEMAVDLGDGTFAVQFKRNGTTTYVRVDADLPQGGWNGLAYAHPSNGGAIWAVIMEKAYTLFRSAANTFNSLNWGWTGSAFSDLGVLTTTFNTGSASLFTQLTNAIANHKAAAAISNGTVAGNIPIIGSHAYTIVSTSVEGGIQYVTVRNPWGTDGAGSDSNPYDGLVKLTFAQFNSAFSSGSIAL